MEQYITYEERVTACQCKNELSTYYDLLSLLLWIFDQWSWILAIIYQNKYNIIALFLHR